MNTPTRIKALFSPVLASSLLFSAAHLASAASDTWVGNTDANWGTAANWNPAAVPAAGDSLAFGSAGSSGIILNNNLTALTAFDSLTFSGGSAFTLNGNSVLLSGGLVGTNVAVVNNSGLTQTFGTMNLTLDSGYYTFSGGLALNGGLTLNPGGVAYFDANNTSTALSLDSATGLITGLEGSGLIFSGNSPTGLATFSAGSIIAYPTGSYVTVASGPITTGSTNNIELTASAATAYSDASATVNTITATQPGNTAGTSTDTLTTTGTLTLGQNGGIYALNGGANKNLLTVTGGTLTAGTTAGASIVMAANGTLQGNSPPNMMTVSSIIANNPGGSVSVVKVGTGSMVINGANTYTGGTYILQGQVQLGASATALGTGPIFVSGNATLLNNIGPGTIANNITLGTGNGSALWNGSGVNPGALMYCFADGNYFYNGVITLLGPPVSLGTAGCRIAGNKDAGAFCIFQNQITGTGTLDLAATPHADFFRFSNNPANHPANNWSGGLIIEETLAAPSTSARNITVQLAFDNQIPSGASAGNVTLASADQTALHSIVQLDLNGHTNALNGLIAPVSLNSTPVQLGNINGTTPSTLTLGANDNNNGGPFTYAGNLLDGGTLAKALNVIKIGAGTQTLSSTNSYLGFTTISNGTLALGGSATFPNSTPISVAAAGTFDVSALGSFTLGSAQTLAGIGTVSGSVGVNGTVNPFFGTIGTLNVNGNVTLNGGSTLVWDVNNAAGTAGTDNGWSLLNVTGGNTLAIGASSGSPMTIKINSFAAGDVPGNTLGFSASGTTSWVIAKSTVPITGFTPNAFTFNTSSFSNPLGSGAFSMSLSGDSLSLILTFTGTPAISTPLVSQTNNAGTTATFTVVANGATAPITFNWTQGSTPLSNGGSSASGGAVTIVNSGHTSTLTIANVQDADAGGITVNVSDTSGDSGISSAILTVIDAPVGASITQSTPQTASPPYQFVSTGGIITLTASASSGTAPLSYAWSLNGVPISGATNAIYNVNLSTSTVGVYTVVISNAAGSSSNTVTINPVTQSPNQIVYEPFNYTFQGSGNTTPWTAFGVTNIFNETTGVGLGWVNSGSANQPASLFQDMRVEAGFNNPIFSPFGDSYPWPGLAGDSPLEVYCNVNSFIKLPLGAGSSISNGPVYFSVIMHVDQGSTITGVGTDFFFGLGTGTSTTVNTGVYIKTPGDDTYIPGIFKTSGGLAALSPGVNGNWSSKAYHRGQIVFAVGRLMVNPGTTNDTFDLWLAPPTSSLGASETNLPASDVTGGANVADVGNVDFFYIRNSAGTGPISRRYADLRIGSTWASVTPPSAPTLALANQVVNLGATAVLASENAGNLALSYSWSYNGGPPLSDNATYSGTATGTLTISNVQPAELGLYTVTAQNQDPLTSATLTGSASATVSVNSPVLSVTYSGANAVIAWPTNFTGYTLEQSPAVTPASNWTTNSLPPYSVVGTNFVVTNSISGNKFFRLIKSTP